MIPTRTYPTHKRCTACGKDVPLDQFCFNMRGKYQRVSQCKPCMAKRNKEYYHSRMPDEVKARQKAAVAVWQRTPNGRACGRRSGARRYAQKKTGTEIASTLTADEWAEILARYDSRCAYCNTEGAPLTQDHVIPLSLGGWHTYANIVPACQSCNSRKGNRILCLDEMS